MYLCSFKEQKQLPVIKASSMRPRSICMARRATHWTVTTGEHGAVTNCELCLQGERECRCETGDVL